MHHHEPHLARSVGFRYRPRLDGVRPFDVREPGLVADEVREIREARWTDLLSQLLAEAGRTVAELARGAEMSDWKIAVVIRLRAAGVPYRWIATKLSLGSASALRGYVFRSEHRTA